MYIPSRVLTNSVYYVFLHFYRYVYVYTWLTNKFLYRYTKPPFLQSMANEKSLFHQLVVNMTKYLSKNGTVRENNEHHKVQVIFADFSLLREKFPLLTTT